jgi:crotonobetainyl-CoA:carnitine CoA-transferase CaiB-like acyl-CoA transferase
VVTECVEARLAELPVGDWLVRLEAAGVPCGPVLAQRTVEADEQVRANGLVETLHQPGLGSVRVLGRVFAVGTDRTRARGPAPELGAHTDEVLAALAADP